MEHLSLSQIERAIPAVRVPPGPKNVSLFSTASWIQQMEGEGYRAFSMVAGPSHSDGTRTAGERRARHLVAMTSDNGEVYAILNGHTIARRAWLGLGVRGQGKYDARFILFACVPVHRGRGTERAMTELAAHRRKVRDIWTAYGRTSLDDNLRGIAKKAAETAYLPLCSTPDWRELAAAMEPEASNPRRAAMALVDKVLTGGALPKAPAVRRLKPIQSADGTMLAANAVGRAIAEGHANLEELPRYVGRA
jgi:hypothetical protein